MLFFGDGSAVYACEWEEAAGGSRTRPRSGQVMVSKEEVDQAAAAAAGRYGLQEGRFGTTEALMDGFQTAPAWTPRPGADSVRSCLDDPAIQTGLT